MENEDTWNELLYINLVTGRVVHLVNDISYSDIGALAKKSNDNALSLVFKIANE